MKQNKDYSVIQSKLLSFPTENKDQE